MSGDMVFETNDEKRFAPAANIASPIEVDEQLTKEFKKIPDKMAFKIGETAKIVGIKAYVLRYWETEFDALKPQKSRHNQRVYMRKDIELIIMIKKLLYKDRFSIEGAREALKRVRKEAKKVTTLQGTAEKYEVIREQVQDFIVDISRLKELFR